VSDSDSRRKPIPRWRKALGIGIAVVLIGPFFYVIFYPAITGTSVNAAFSQAFSVVLPALVAVTIPIYALAGYDLYRRYVRQPSEEEEESL